MTYASMELRAERSILKAMGVPAVFTTYTGETYNLDVLPVDQSSRLKSGDFLSRDTDKTFEAIATDLPTDWRDGSLTVSGKTFFVLDVTPDEYGQRVKIRVE